jgi:hypothetical protein
MFFKKLYQQNKILFITVVVFLSAYLFLNIKWGVIATPVQQYGMFSGKFNIEDPIPVYLIKANGKMINHARLSPIERDLLQAYPEYYQTQQSNNEAVYNSMKKFLFTGGIFVESRHKDKFFNQVNDTIFSNWYRARVSEIINAKVDSLEVYEQFFQWKDHGLHPIDTPAKLKFIVAR